MNANWREVCPRRSITTVLGKQLGWGLSSGVGLLATVVLFWRAWFPFGSPKGHDFIWVLRDE